MMILALGKLNAIELLNLTLSKKNSNHFGLSFNKYILFVYDPFTVKGNEYILSLSPGFAIAL